jgi:hypothetical protein
MFGRDVTTPLDVLLRQPQSSTDNEVSAIETYLLRVLDGLHAAFTVMRDDLLTREATTDEKNRALLDKLAPHITFEVDDLVLWSNEMVDPGRKHAFDPRFTGPWRVITRYGAGCYKIEMLGGGNTCRIANASQLKRYHSRLEHFPPDDVDVVYSRIDSDPELHLLGQYYTPVELCFD